MTTAHCGAEWGVLRTPSRSGTYNTATCLNYTTNWHQSQVSDSAGSGHRLRMRRWMREHGLAETVFEEIGHTFRVTFHGPGDRILDLIPEEGVTDLRALGLNERQIEALRLMVNEGKELTNRWYRETFGITDRTALRDLSGLIAAGQAQRVGKGRNVRYIAT